MNMSEDKPRAGAIYRTLVTAANQASRSETLGLPIDRVHICDLADQFLAIMKGLPEKLQTQHIQSTLVVEGIKQAYEPVPAPSKPYSSEEKARYAQQIIE